jgi:hypothetical protein
MLNAAGRVVYVNEPLNPKHPPGGSPGILRARIDHRFQYICDENGEPFLRAYRDLVRLRYHLGAELAVNHRPADQLRAARHAALFTRGRLTGRRALVADPFAVFSAEWLARRLGFRVVVMVRHPLAVVGSRKRLGWAFDRDALLAQPLLVRDRLAPVAERWPGALEPPTGVVDGGARLWRLVYEAVLDQRIPGMVLAHHEHLAVDPVGGFARLYAQLGLPFHDRARMAVREASSATNPEQLPATAPHGVRVNSSATIDSWRTRLSGDEVRHVMHVTGPVAGVFYPDDAATAPARDQPDRAGTP